VVDRLLRGACLCALLIAVIPLLSVLYYVASRGLSGLDWPLLTKLPAPVGEPGGGIAHALEGTLILVALAIGIGIPVGIAAGIFVAEFGGGRVGWCVRFAADVMSGIPSISIGIFVYTLVVVPMGHFSALAGGLALGLLTIPTTMRSTEELLRVVPHSLREAALALGVPRWRTTVRVVLRTAMPGIVTGVMLSVARVAGESAPLLFTAFGNRDWSRGPKEPIASLSVQIYTYAVSPYAQWHRQAWAGALVLVAFVLALNLGARLLVSWRGDRGRS
jgi:phosphate transport system permease protein